jgi:hypothetical protein
MTISAPRWDVSNVYPSLESKEFQAAVEITRSKSRRLKNSSRTNSAK